MNNVESGPDDARWSTEDLTVTEKTSCRPGDRPLSGWKEWVRLPDLGTKRRIKAKVDTGAATSALHAEDLHLSSRDGVDFCSFTLLPRQNSRDGAITVEQPLVAIRTVRSSNGQTEDRPVISTDLRLGPETWPIELTLTSRDLMGFRMLLGRSALENRIVVDVSQVHILGK